MNRRRSRLMLVCGLIVFASQLGLAAPVTWEQNGHSYEVIVSGPISWPSAQSAAEAKGGYLATITSLDELMFVFNLTTATPGAWISSGQWAIGPWLGGSDAASEGTWEWVTGEPWEIIRHPDYPDPDCSEVNGDYLIFWGLGAPSPTCNDASGSYHSYVIEYDSESVKVETFGPHSIVLCNPIGRNPKLTATIQANGTPKGGRYEWTILNGYDKIQLLGNNLGKRVRIQAMKESGLNEVVLRVSYTVGSQVRLWDHPLTVQKPTAVELLWTTTETKLNKDRQVIDYTTTFDFRVLNHFVPPQPINVKGMYVVEDLEVLPDYTYDPGKVKEWEDYTDTYGMFKDSLSPDVRNKVLDLLTGQLKAIPLDYYVSLKQNFFVEGWNVATRHLTFHYDKATSEPWIEP